MVYTLQNTKEKASQYKTRTEFLKNALGYYKYATKNNILNIVCSHMPRKVGVAHNKKWTIENIKIEALKYQNRYEFKKNNPSAHNAAKKYNLLNIIYSNKGKFRNAPYTEEEIFKEIKKYNTKYEFKKNNPYLYRILLKKENKEYFFSKFPKNSSIGKKPHNKRWYEENIKIEALKYQTRNQFWTNSSGAYDAALRLNILDQICQHMKKPGGNSVSEKNLFDLIKQKYPKAQKFRDRKVNISNRPHIKGFDIDIYIPELRKGIEFDGAYWHSVEGLKRSRNDWPQEDLENYSHLKDQHFLSKDIKILHIDEKEWLKDPNNCIQKCFEFLNIK